MKRAGAFLVKLPNGATIRMSGEAITRIWRMITRRRKAVGAIVCCGNDTDFKDESGKYIEDGVFASMKPHILPSS